MDIVALMKKFFPLFFVICGLFLGHTFCMMAPSFGDSFCTRAPSLGNSFCLGPISFDKCLSSNPYGQEHQDNIAIAKEIDQALKTKHNWQEFLKYHINNKIYALTLAYKYKYEEIIRNNNEEKPIKFDTQTKELKELCLKEFNLFFEILETKYKSILNENKFEPKTSVHNLSSLVIAFINYNKPVLIKKLEKELERATTEIIDLFRN